MTSAAINLHISNALPPGNDTESRQVLLLWQQIATFFDKREFKAAAGIRSQENVYRVTVDCSALINLMETALSNSGSFDKHIVKDTESVDRLAEATLVFTIDGDPAPSRHACYELVTVLTQQILLAAHIARPGSVQLLRTQFEGEAAQRYEAQQFDANILYGAGRAARQNAWPPLADLSFEQVWQWLEVCETACTHTALRDINKVLFTLLKVAEQRHEYSARTVLLVIYQLETLMACRQPGRQDSLGARLRMVLGAMPEAADCIRELQEVRNNLFVASQPVHRPPLISHNTSDALREQVGQHNSAVEHGVAIVIALLQDLVRHQKQSYTFTESWQRT